MLIIENVNKKEIAYMATQYDDMTHSVDGAILHALGDAMIEDMADDEIVSKYIEMREEWQYDMYYTLDDDTLDEVLESYSPNEIVRKTLFGEFSYNDDYFIINDYENLESFSKSQLADEARKDYDFNMYLTSGCSDLDMDWLEDVRKIYLDLLKKGY